MTMKVIERRNAIQPRRDEDKGLEKRHHFLQSVIDGVSEPIVVIGTDLRVKLNNHAAKIFPAFNKDTRDDQYCYRLMFGLDKPCYQAGKDCPLVEVLETGKTVSVEHQHELSDGRKHYYEILASPLVSDDGDYFGIIETLREITSRKLVEQELQQAKLASEQKVKERTAELINSIDALRQEIEDRQWAEEELLKSKDQADLVYRVIPSAIFTVDMERRITSWNDKAETLTGFTRAEVIGKDCNIFALHPCTVVCGIFSANVDKPIMNKLCEIRTKKGDIRVVSKNADLLRDLDGNVIGAVESFEDITELKQFEEELRTERDKFRGMLQAMGQGMHILNKDFGIEYQNDVLRKSFGDKMGYKCYEVYKNRDKPCEICRMQEAVKTMEIQRTELLMANGRYYEQSYAPFTDIDGEVKTLILLRDITEEKMYQAETLRAGQLASIGELAAGVAHEINNPINGIINYAQILQDEAQNEGQIDLLERVIREGERIAEIVKNLLSFARQHDEDGEETCIAVVMEDALKLIQHQFLKDGIKLQVEIADNLPKVFANSKQLQQVFLNLLSNARYALNQRHCGKDPQKKIAIKSHAVKLDGRKYVRTTITDWGTGIPAEIINKIFDPFFSSKKPGEGTGLGLSISHGLVRDFNGFLRVESKVDKYTTMIVELPVYGN